MEHPPSTLGRSCFFYALGLIPTNCPTKRVILDRDQHNSLLNVRFRGGIVGTGRPSTKRGAFHRGASWRYRDLQASRIRAKTLTAMPTMQHTITTQVAVLPLTSEQAPKKHGAVTAKDKGQDGRSEDL
jgi:hypothetical protein